MAGIPLGIAESAKDALLLSVHLPEIIKGLGKAIYFMAETMMFNDAEAFGSSLALQHADERNELIKQGVIQAAAAVTNAVEHASWHDRCKGATRLIADFYVPGKIYSAVGHLFAGVVAQSKNLRNLENAASMMDHEFGFEQIVEEVLQTTKSLEPATPDGIKGQILAEFMEAESVIVKEAEVLHSEMSSLDKSTKSLMRDGSESIRINKYGIIEKRSFIEKKISALEKAQQKAEHIIELSDGRIRYYEKECLSKTHGPTRGRSHVTEFDPKTGRVRQWSECYDYEGKVNRINPKMIDGKEINSFHYPRTKKELEIIAQLMKGKK